MAGFAPSTAIFQMLYIREDILWTRFLQELQEGLLGLGMHRGKIWTLCYRKKGPITGTLYVGVVDERGDIMTLNVNKHHATNFMVISAPIWCLEELDLAQAYAKGIGDVIRRLARSYGAWERREGTVRG